MFVTFDSPAPEPGQKDVKPTFTILYSLPPDEYSYDRVRAHKNYDHKSPYYHGVKSSFISAVYSCVPKLFVSVIMRLL